MPTPPKTTNPTLVVCPWSIRETTFREGISWLLRRNLKGNVILRGSRRNEFHQRRQGDDRNWYPIDLCCRMRISELSVANIHSTRISYDFELDEKVEQETVRPIPTPREKKQTIKAIRRDWADRVRVVDVSTAESLVHRLSKRPARWSKTSNR